MLRQAEARGLLSLEHFTVDGTLLEAWVSQTGFQPKDRPGTDGDDDPGNPTVSLRGEHRSNTRHTSTTDPDARLAKTGPGKEAKLSYLASVTLDNRHGLVVATAVDSPSGTGEREQAVVMLSGLTDGRCRATVGADRGYATREFIREVQALGIAPHVAQGAGPPVLDGCTTRHPGYAVSQRHRKRIEESFGWAKTGGLLRKLRHRGRALVDWVFTSRWRSTIWSGCER